MKNEIVIGQTYNMLTVVEFDRKEKGDYYYKCKCGVCGKIVSKRKDKILSNPKSCGCLSRIEDLNDIVGQKVGKLTVIEYDHKVYNGKKTNHYYKCKCDCGNTCIVRRDGLKSGHSSSCGCTRKIEDLNDIVGQKFGKLTVIKYDHRDKSSRNFYLCKCDCGNESIVCRDDLKSGNTQSCGCYRKDLFVEKVSTHKMSDTRFYKIYINMKQRCTNPNDSAYQYYGGRGIKVCDEWLVFDNFYNDMYESYCKHTEEYGEDNTTIDRIDVNGNYCPENCRWTTMKVQDNNKTNNHYITYNGETLSMMAMFEKYKTGNLITYDAFKKRIYNGWSVYAALYTPLKEYADQGVLMPIRIINDDFIN